VPAASRFDLSGRVALVTGASRGIGSAIAEALAEQGANVVLSSRKQADLDSEAERINVLYQERATPIAAHSGRPEDLERLVKAVVERFSRIDILVNNAATNPYFGPVIGRARRLGQDVRGQPARRVRAPYGTDWCPRGSCFGGPVPGLGRG